MIPAVRSTTTALALAAVTTFVLFAACHQTNLAATLPATTPPATTLHAISIPTPPLRATQPIDHDGLHNVVTYAPDLVCGGVPEGDTGLRTLAAMGIKTILSVDGQAPAVAAAAQLGMRYVHLPISYDGVTLEQQTQLAAAITSLPGPLYLHCHHGKHRSGAGLATALVRAGKLTPEQAMARMQVSGTAKEYTGLWQAVRDAQPLDAASLQADPNSFPAITKVSGLVATMAEIDRVFDYVKQAQKAAWSAPKDHPDLIANKETGRLRTLFAQLKNDPDSLLQPADYQTRLDTAIATANALDAAVTSNDATAADRMLATMTATCKQCHKTYRDN